jgi:hypothetical protein
MERPILFSTPMVQAILAGTKTQTRRIIKPQPMPDMESGYTYYNNKLVFDIHNWKEEILCVSRIQKNMILWVRETWQEGKLMDDDENVIHHGYLYKATDVFETDPELTGYEFKWKPSIFMPKEACRLKLKVTDLRVERLQDISEQDAIKEGLTFSESFIDGKFHCLNDNLIPVESYKNLWEHINGKGSWDKNPWVWVIEFERIEL